MKSFEPLSRASGDNVYRSLPQYLINGQTLYENFETIGQWGAHSTCLVTANTTQKLLGTQSMKITTNGGAGSSGYAQKNPGTVFGSAQTFQVNLYFHDLNCARVTIYYGDGTNYFYQIVFFAPGTLGWKTCTLPHDNWSTIGSPTWGMTITDTHITVSSIIGGAGDTAVSVDSFYCYRDGIPAVLMAFDDGTSDQYTYAYTELKKRNMVASYYVVSNNLNIGGYFTSTQLQEMYANGHDIANHTRDHTDLVSGGLTDVQIMAEMTDCRDFLNALGLYRASSFLAYPSGSNNAQVQLDAQSTGMKWCRTTTGGRGIILPVVNSYAMTTKNYFDGATTSLANAKATVDDIVSKKYPGMLFGHHLITGVAGSGQWNKDDFISFLDYIVAQNVQTLTLSELYALQFGSVIVGHR